LSKITDPAQVQPLVYRGVSKISAVAGINPSRFTYYRTRLGLPVFKTDEKSNVWMVTHTDLMGWIEERKKCWREKE